MGMPAGAVGKCSGVGTNSGKYPSVVNKRIVAEYGYWNRMLHRCFVKRIEFRNYTNCEVSPCFLNYEYFYEWCQEQVGYGSRDEAGKLYHLDKDILALPNKGLLYSPETCVFIPTQINSLPDRNAKKDNGLPSGVFWDKVRQKYRSECSTSGKSSVYVGRFDSADEAYAAFKDVRRQHILQVAEKYRDKVDIRVYNQLLNLEV